MLSLLGRGWFPDVAVEPQRQVVAVELLAPHQSCEGLPHDPFLVGGGSWCSEPGIELIGLGLTVGEHFLEAGLVPARHVRVAVSR